MSDIEYKFEPHVIFGAPTPQGSTGSVEEAVFTTTSGTPTPAIAPHAFKVRVEGFKIYNTPFDTNPGGHDATPEQVQIDQDINRAVYGKILSK